MLVVAVGGGYESQLPCQEEAQVATMSVPVTCMLDACCKVLQCPGLLIMPMSGCVCLGHARGPDSWWKVQ